MGEASCAAPATAAEIEEIGEGLLARTFPGDRFHHREHLLATAYLMWCRPELELRRELPDIIRRFNVAMGGKNTDDAGYHHTITIFYVDAIEQFFDLAASHDLVTLCNAMLESPLRSKEFPLHFYTRDLLFSKEARRAWVDPDLRDIAELRSVLAEQAVAEGVT